MREQCGNTIESCCSGKCISTRIVSSRCVNSEFARQAHRGVPHSSLRSRGCWVYSLIILEGNLVHGPLVTGSSQDIIKTVPNECQTWLWRNNIANRTSVEDFRSLLCADGGVVGLGASAARCSSENKTVQLTMSLTKLEQPILCSFLSLLSIPHGFWWEPTIPSFQFPLSTCIKGRSCPTPQAIILGGFSRSCHGKRPVSMTTKAVATISAHCPEFL